MIRPLDGLKADGTAIINCHTKQLDTLNAQNDKSNRLFYIDATEIAHAIYGRTTIPITNVIIMGAYCAATGDVSLESIFKVLPDYFPEDKLEVNRKAAQMGFEGLKECKF